MIRGIDLDLGVNFWDSFTVSLVASAHVEGILFVDSQSIEKEVLLELQEEDHRV